jgi:hypothetical protein
MPTGTTTPGTGVFYFYLLFCFNQFNLILILDLTTTKNPSITGITVAESSNHFYQTIKNFSFFSLLFFSIFKLGVQRQIF